jgi:hypothetical protein
MTGAVDPEHHIRGRHRKGRPGNHCDASFAVHLAPTTPPNRCSHARKPSFRTGCGMTAMRANVHWDSHAQLNVHQPTGWAVAKDRRSTENPQARCGVDYLAWES